MAMLVLPGEPGQNDDGTTAAYLFHALSDPSRLAILRHLRLGEHRVVDLVAHLGLAQSTVSKHLACLRDCGLVTSRPQGRASLFSLTHDAALAELLTAGEKLIDLTGGASATCRTAHCPDVCPDSCRAGTCPFIDAAAS